MAHLPRISQKDSTSRGRKILPPSKVKNLLAKHGKRYQVFHRQWVSLSSFKKTTHHSTRSIRDFNFWWIWIHSCYNRSVHEICAGMLLQTSLQKLLLKNFSMILCWNLERQIELEKYFGSKTCRTTPYRPMANGMVERLNSKVIQTLHTLPEKLKYKWKDSLNKLLYVYNCTKHSVTGYSPYFLLFGRNSKLPIDIILSEHQ